MEEESLPFGAFERNSANSIQSVYFIPFPRRTVPSSQPFSGLIQSYGSNAIYVEGEHITVLAIRCYYLNLIKAKIRYLEEFFSAKSKTSLSKLIKFGYVVVVRL